MPFMPNAIAPTRRAFLAGVTATGASLALSNPILALGAVPQTGSPDEAWLNPPKHWRTEGSSLVCTADPKTDFWRKTFYGYVTDTGHLRYRRVQGDFTTQVKLSGQYRDLYDQAGLMVRIDAENWMKCGVEFVDGNQNMSIVYTRGFSSWATGRLPGGPSSLWLKVVRKGARASHLSFARWKPICGKRGRLSGNRRLGDGGADVRRARGQRL
jgi:regulation of enolase protein 1 (concanavalin A-like superfamily)